MYHRYYSYYCCPCFIRAALGANKRHLSALRMRPPRPGTTGAQAHGGRSPDIAGEGEPDEHEAGWGDGWPHRHHRIIAVS